MKFTTQRNIYACAPVTILNILRWASLGIHYNTHYNQICVMCKTTGLGYTHDNDFNNTLRHYSKRFNFITKESSIRCGSSISNLLKQEKYAALVGRKFSDKEWHWSFWYGYGRGMYWGANIEHIEELRVIAEQNMNNMLNEDSCRIIIIEKTILC